VNLGVGVFGGGVGGGMRAQEGESRRRGGRTDGFEKNMNNKGLFTYGN